MLAMLSLSEYTLRNPHAGDEAVSQGLLLVPAFGWLMVLKGILRIWILTRIWVKEAYIRSPIVITGRLGHLGF
jgi:hypothetical protein